LGPFGKTMASKPLTITIPLDASIVEGVVNGDKVCLGLISKAVQAAIEQGYHLGKTEVPARPAGPAGHRCVVSDDIWEFLQVYYKSMGKTLIEV
jgi:hypothetical protein